MTWIEVNLPWYASGEIDDPPGFIRPNFHDRARAGMVIEMEDGTRYLIGDINRNGGTADEFQPFDDRTIVRRYAVVWEEEGK